MENKSGFKSIQEYRTYPVYQLWMYDDSNRIDVIDKFKIAILTVIEWLKDHIPEGDVVPDSLKINNPKDYKLFDLTSLKNISIRKGYEIETVYIDKEKIYVASFKTTDREDIKKEDRNEYDNVRGRTILTEYSLKISDDNKLEVFVYVEYIEPNDEDIKISVPARPAVVKKLILNPNLEFYQTSRIQRDYLEINDKKQIDYLYDSLSKKECGLNAVILVEKEVNNKIDDINVLNAATIANNITTNGLLKIANKSALTVMPSFSSSKIIVEGVKPDIDKLQKERRKNNKEIQKLEKEINTIEQQIKNGVVRHLLPISNFEALSQSGMGYSVFYTLKYEMIPYFKKVFSMHICGGELLMITPLRYNGKKSRQFSNNDPIEIDFYNSKIGYDIRMSQHHRFGIDRGNTISIDEAKELSNKSSESLKEELQRIKKEHLSKQVELSKKNDSDLQNLISLHERENVEYEKEIERLSLENEALKEQLKSVSLQKENLKIELNTKSDIDEEILRFWKNKRDVFKMNQNDLISWVNKNFEGKILLHKNAIEDLLNLDNSEINMDLYTETIEFLAKEYRDYRLNSSISEKEYLDLCNGKYEREFEVTPVGEKTLSDPVISKDYRIKYHMDKKESYCNLHLKYGVHSPNLLRIYFLVDKNKDNLIVIGRIGKHLGTYTERT